MYSRKALRRSYKPVGSGWNVLTWGAAETIFAANRRLGSMVGEAIAVLGDNKPVTRLAPYISAKAWVGLNCC